MTTTSVRPRRVASKPPKTPTLRFDQRLVLNKYLLSLFGADSLETLAYGMQRRELEGLDADNISRFCQSLLSMERPGLTKDLLLQYDQNIVAHTVALQGTRAETITWKYFQYLALLFTEIYLDRYFGDPDALRDALNEYVQGFNSGKTEADQVQAYTPEDLRKVAIWSATGSGKTLLMHMNILQFRHYLTLRGRTDAINRTILLTPNEGLSRQHLEEFTRSGLPAELFDKDSSGLFAGQFIEIIDVNKLRDESGDKTVAVDAFEGNNFVLVDEGHRGAGGDEWMTRRNKLCQEGFSFEYSATFEQALKAADKPALTQEYLRCILFDYSYKYFYGDGYGKDYRILNLPDDSDEDIQRLYLTACLVTFYQQQRLFARTRQQFAPFLLDKPLWVFVGSSVTKSVSTEDRTDTVEIVRFLARFVREKAETVRVLDRLLSGQPGLLDAEKREIFGDCFGYLIASGYTGRSLYDDILKTLFNATSASAFYVRNMTGVDGEIALQVGTGAPFGVINVGDDKALCKLLDTYPDEVSVDERAFAQSLFQDLNSPHSTVNVLIGSRKFSEGWNSWRVSTMGLMRVGRNEGAQIIQLFGRGVRLKGYGFGLQRSAFTELPPDKIPEYIDLLETLNVFGVKADYMDKFKEYLRDEGLPSKGPSLSYTLIPSITHKVHTLALKTLKLKDGVDFKAQGPTPILAAPPTYLQNHKITLNWYPKLQAIQSMTGPGGDAATYHEGSFAEQHVAFLDLDAMYLDLQAFKHERGWHKYDLDRDTLARLLINKPAWYKLQLPEEELAFTSFDKIRRWQEIGLTLLKKYVEKYYKYRKDEWERPKLEYGTLDESDPNFIKEYQFSIEQSQSYWVAKLDELKQQIVAGTLQDYCFNKLIALHVDQHLYSPLLHLKKGSSLSVTPVALNEGEEQFVRDLRTFLQEHKGFLGDADLYLLRNKSQKGIGFFEASNFYPDFILWIVADGTQRIAFIDPKGIRNLEGLQDAKIGLHETIKEIETRLGDPRTKLFSFIISNTPYSDVRWWTSKAAISEFERRNVLFQKDDPRYIEKLLQQVCTDISAGRSTVGMLD